MFNLGIGKILGGCMNPIGNFFKRVSGAIESLNQQHYQNDVSRGAAGHFAQLTQGSVAANQNASLGGGRIVHGGDNDTFAFNPQAGKSYNLLADSGLNFNGKYGNTALGTKLTRTGTTVAGPNGNTTQVTFDKSGKALFNGKPMIPGRTYTMADGGTARLDRGPGFKGFDKGNNVLNMTTGEGYKIKQEIQNLPGKAGDYIKTTVQTPHHGVDGDFRMPGGILGETFDADRGRQHGTERSNQNTYVVPGGIYGTPQGQETALYS